MGVPYCTLLKANCILGALVFCTVGAMNTLTFTHGVLQCEGCEYLCIQVLTLCRYVFRGIALLMFCPLPLSLGVRVSLVRYMCTLAHTWMYTCTSRHKYCYAYTHAQCAAVLGL